MADIFNKQLETNGYLIVRNALTSLQLSIAANTIKSDGKVDYNQLKKFIDQIYFKKFNSVLGWNCTYNKFRFSSTANSNLKDAASFHGDVYNFTEHQIMPVYTALCYLDSAIVEIIPKTHKGKVSSDAYKSRIRISINPGDIMIFHANLHHRGIPGSNERRLLQIFEIFPNESFYKKYNPKLITVLTSQCWPIKYMHGTNKSFKSEVTTDNFCLGDKIHYWAVVNNIQYSSIGLDIPFEKKINKFIGYEPGPRDTIKHNQTQPLNINIIIRPHDTMVPSCVKINFFLGMILALIIWFGYKYIVKLFKAK